tara:strand:- start:8056 stop:8451 length:396 start_codon:yes stop_codon:yes gene_type:complete
MHPTIEIIEVGLLDLNIVDSPSSDQTWGFLIQPSFKEEGVNLRIRFELIFPINSKQHIFCKTITGFFLENFNSDYLKNEVETVTGLIQTAMANTRLFVMQKYNKFNYVQMKYFDNKYFVDELNRQIKELNI